MQNINTKFIGIVPYRDYYKIAVEDASLENIEKYNRCHQLANIICPYENIQSMDNIINGLVSIYKPKNIYLIEKGPYSFEGYISYPELPKTLTNKYQIEHIELIEYVDIVKETVAAQRGGYH